MSVIIAFAFCVYVLYRRDPRNSHIINELRTAPQSHDVVHVPAIWRRFGARRPADVMPVMRNTSRRAVFAALVDEYLAPWSSATADVRRRVPVSKHLIDSMEVPLKASTARIRLSGDGRVLYRVVEHWEKTYRLPRLSFFMSLLVKVMARFPEVQKTHAEFYLNSADGPRSTVDSMSQEFGALPIIGFRSERHYIDIPIPDPVEHGAKVTGAGYVIEPDATIAPWHEKEPRAIFRGVASCIQKQHFGNWHLSPRVRVSSISARHPHLLDAGITKWIKLSHNATAEEVMRSANFSTQSTLSLKDQLAYKYILDVDGGLGSSRKRWMLRSGSTPFFQESTVFQWYEPLLAEWVHFVPVDRWFRDLIENIIWARQHDDEAHAIARNAQEFAYKFLSEDAIFEYLAVFVQKYSNLQPDARHGKSPVANPCIEEPSLSAGPMGCRKGWFRHFLDVPIPFGCRHKPHVEGSFVCHRPNPITGRKEVKHGVYAEYPPAPEGMMASLRRHRLPQAGYHNPILTI